MPVDLMGKKALITGAGKGIGRSIAEHLAKEGVDLGLIARTKGNLLQVKQDIESRYNVKVAISTANVGNRSEVDRAVSELAIDLGNVDILVNNAGISKFGRIVDMPVEDWEDMIQVNLLGSYYVTRAVLPQMIAQNSGNIINISSTAGERASATTSAYSASKFGLMGFTESLMQEVRKNNIRVIALLPSTVNTELAINAGLKIGDEEHQMQPEDLGQFVVSVLKLPQRVTIKNATLFMTNPQ